MAEIMLLFFCFFLPAIYYTKPQQGTEDFNLALNMVQYITTSIPQLLLLMYIIWIKKEVVLKNFGIVLPRLNDLLLGIVLAATLFIFIFLLSLLLQLIPEKNRNFILPENPLIIQDKSNIFLVILFSLVTGYKEELFFRSYLLTRLRQLGIRTLPAVITGSLLFAILHLYEGLFGFLFAGIAAVYFSIIYIKTKSLNLIALSHAIFNAAMILLL